MVSASAQAPVAAPAAVPPKPAPAKIAQKTLDKPLWSNLTRAQQTALAPIADEWDQADGVRKQKWLDIANRFASMKPDEQARVHARMRDLFKMTPEERRVVRENYTRAKKIDPSQKSEEWEKYQQLPDEKKKQLAEEAANARAKKQVANLPSPAQSSVKTVAPIKSTAPVLAECGPGTVKNSAALTSPCLPISVLAPAPVPAPTSVPVPAATGTAAAPPTPPSPTPAVPANNANQ
ncbi:MAG: DUF3106 domain-containing protein [Massilia sp.]|nr:DUF3106 domain-containing protein [Massilia sp.]